MLRKPFPVQRKQQAFIQILDGETHHVQRDVALKKAKIMAYGCIDEEEKDVFRQLIGRNAKNMNKTCL